MTTDELFRLYKSRQTETAIEPRLRDLDEEFEAEVERYYKNIVEEFSLSPEELEDFKKLEWYDRRIFKSRRRLMSTKEWKVAEAKKKISESSRQQFEESTSSLPASKSDT